MSDKPLMSLEEWNRQRRALRSETVSPRNGIACPICGSEMLDEMAPGTILTADLTLTVRFIKVNDRWQAAPVDLEEIRDLSSRSLASYYPRPLA